jgi:hypothetical protein
MFTVLLAIKEPPQATAPVAPAGTKNLQTAETPEISAERAAAAVILGETLDSPDQETFLVTTAEAAFVLRERMHFWD